MIDTINDVTTVIFAVCALFLLLAASIVTVIIAICSREYIIDEFANFKADMVARREKRIAAQGKTGQDDSGKNSEPDNAVFQPLDL